MTSLVGYTGFVGSNLYEADRFDAIYNSKNIREAYGTKPDLLIYAGLRAEKYLANQAPEKDMEQIRQAEENIAQIQPKRIVLISTIDVFKVPDKVDEYTVIDTEKLHPYGYNRYQLEIWVRERYQDVLIVRLPGLYGKNIKKNFIYDYINRIPFMLNSTKMDELADADAELRAYYDFQENGFYKIKTLHEAERKKLKEKFKRVGFSAINFTDSRSIYQFYNLKRLWKDIRTALNLELKLWHPATEPVSAAELYEYLSGEKFVNEFMKEPVKYDYRTVYDGPFGGSGGYIETKDEVLNAIREFVQTYE